MINGRNAERVASAEAAMRAEGLRVVGVVGSMDTEPAVEILADQAIASFGRIDLVVSTVGGAPTRSRSTPSARSSSSRRSV